MLKEGLPCNCIPGFLLNYAAYVILNCLSLEGETVDGEFIYEDGTPYFLIQCDKEMIIPNRIYADKELEYIMKSRICNNKNRIYWSFAAYKSIEEITEQIEKSDWQSKPFKLVEGSSIFEFWIDFLGALRTTNQQKACRAILFMAIYTFPNLTLRYMKQYIENDKISTIEDKSKLVYFFVQYLEFLNELIGCSTECEFLFEFVKAFNKRTEVNVSDFIERFERVKRSEELSEYIWSFYRRNIQECNRRAGHLKKIAKLFEKDEKLKEKDADNINRISELMCELSKKHMI